MENARHNCVMRLCISRRNHATSVAQSERRRSEHNANHRPRPTGAAFVGRDAAARRAWAGRGNRAGPPDRYLRHRFARLQRGAAVLQLSAHSGARTWRGSAGARAGRRPGGADRGWRPLRGGAIFELRQVCRLSARQDELLRRAANARRPHRWRDARGDRVATRQTAPRADPLLRATSGSGHE
jgi:hypothetical protein